MQDKTKTFDRWLWEKHGGNQEMHKAAWALVARGCKASAGEGQLQLPSLTSICYDAITRQTFSPPNFDHYHSSSQLLSSYQNLHPEKPQDQLHNRITMSARIPTSTSVSESAVIEAPFSDVWHLIKLQDFSKFWSALDKSDWVKGTSDEADIVKWTFKDGTVVEVKQEEHSVCLPTSHEQETEH